MVNVRGFLYTLLHARVAGHSLEQVTFLVSAALMLIVAAALCRRASLTLGCALVLVVTLLTSYHAYSYDAALLLPAFFLTGSYLRDRKLNALDLMMGLTAYALFLFPLVSVSFQNLVIGMFLGMLTLASLQSARLYALRRASAELSHSQPTLRKACAPIDSGEKMFAKFQRRSATR